MVNIAPLYSVLSKMIAHVSASYQPFNVHKGLLCEDNGRQRIHVLSMLWQHYLAERRHKRVFVLCRESVLTLSLQ